MNNKYEFIRLLVQARAIINLVNHHIETPVFYVAVKKCGNLFLYIAWAHVKQPFRGTPTRVHLFMF